MAAVQGLPVKHRAPERLIFQTTSMSLSQVGVRQPAAAEHTIGTHDFRNDSALALSSPEHAKALIAAGMA
jgi:hypothetical protein